MIINFKTVAGVYLAVYNFPESFETLRQLVLELHILLKIRLYVVGIVSTVSTSRAAS